MSFKTILVHADAGAGGDRRVRLALAIANRFDAAVVGLGAACVDPLIASGNVLALEALRVSVTQELSAAKVQFRARAGDAAEWIDGEGYPDRMLALNARGADLIVSSRPARGESATYAAKVAELVSEAAAPVLLAPDNDVVFRGDHVVAAWRDNRESWRAVTDALPLLQQAQSVTLLSVRGDAKLAPDEPESLAKGLLAVAKRLSRHGVKAEIEVAPKGSGTVTESIEDAAARHSADLIVAGAAVRARLQEWWLGGVTEDFMTACSKFVLLSH